MTTLVLSSEVYAIIAAAIAVHRELGSGFLESVYQEALEIELGLRCIPFESQKPIQICYRKRMLRHSYIADLVCYDQVVVELKALNQLTTRETAQLLHYLKVTEMRVGLLINFGSLGRLEWKRLVR